MKTNEVAANLINKARDAGLTITTAESCTGGLIAGALTDIAGSSDVFDRGFVTYSNEAKQEMLDVSQNSLDRFGAVSETVAKEMAYGAIVHSGCDMSVAVTGVAGPGGGTELKPVGTVWIATAQMGQAPVATMFQFGESLTREKIREVTVDQSLKLLINLI